MFEGAGNYKDAKAYVDYCQAQVYCSAGNYYDAFDLIRDSTLAESKSLLRNIYFETRLPLFWPSAYFSAGESNTLSISSLYISTELSSSINVKF